MIRGSSSRVPGTSSGISITLVWPSNFSKTLQRATVGKAGIVSGRPWQSMMKSAGKVTALVCSEAIMMSIWTHCRDHLHGLQRKEALVSETNMGIVISGPLDLWLCSGYLPFCRYPPTGLPDVFAFQHHFPLPPPNGLRHTSATKHPHYSLLLAMLIIFPPNADFLANIVLVPIDSTRATLAPIHESVKRSSNKLSYTCVPLPTISVLNWTCHRYTILLAASAVDIAIRISCFTSCFSLLLALHHSLSFNIQTYTYIHRFRTNELNACTLYHNTNLKVSKTLF
jgi:hypothetical protein